MTRTVKSFTIRTVMLPACRQTGVPLERSALSRHTANLLAWQFVIHLMLQGASLQPRSSATTSEWLPEEFGRGVLVASRGSDTEFICVCRTSCSTHCPAHAAQGSAPGSGATTARSPLPSTHDDTERGTDAGSSHGGTPLLQLVFLCAPNLNSFMTNACPGFLGHAPACCAQCRMACDETVECMIRQGAEWVRMEWSRGRG